MKQAIAPALLTQSDLHLDPLAGGNALADGGPITSIKRKNPPTRDTAQLNRLIATTSLFFENSGAPSHLRLLGCPSHPHILSITLCSIAGPRSNKSRRTYSLG